MTESIPPEGQQPLTQAQIHQLRRSMREKILERAESDPQWKQLLLEDPELAMREANFLEAQHLGQRGAPQEAEVMGQQEQGGGGHGAGHVGGVGRYGRRRRYGYYGYGRCRRWWLTF